MRFIYNNLSVIYVALVTSLMAWLYGGIRSALLVDTVPWLMLFMVEIMFCFPQRRDGETTGDARERVWRSMRKDALVWVSVALLAVLAIPFVNTGLCTTCDYLKIMNEGVSPEPPVKFLPFCVNRMEHLNVYLWFVTALSCLVATKHCLRRRGRRLLLELIVWNGFGLAVLGFVQVVTMAPGPLWDALPDAVGRAPQFFSTWGYPNMAGDYFVTLFGLSVGLWRHHYDRIRTEIETAQSGQIKKPRTLFWRQNVYLVPATLFFFAAQNTLCRAAIVEVTVLSLVFFAHTFLSFAARMHRVKRVKATAISVLVFGIVAFCGLTFMPDEIRREVNTIGTTETLDRVTGKGQYHVRVATQIFRQNLLFGCGGWGYKHFCLANMEPEERRSLQRLGGVNVHNDYMQFLAEHGLVGFGLMLTVFLLAVGPFVSAWQRLVKAAAFDKQTKLAKPMQVFVIPAPVFCILSTVIATLVHAFGDCPLRSPAILTLLFVSLAALYGFMPKEAVEETRHHNHPRH